jgi:hypothetical protein
MDITNSPSTRSFSAEVWTYRGYHLKPGEFNTAMIHCRDNITKKIT